MIGSHLYNSHIFSDEDDLSDFLRALDSEPATGTGALMSALAGDLLAFGAQRVEIFLINGDRVVLRGGGREIVTDLASMRDLLTAMAEDDRGLEVTQWAASETKPDL